MRKLVGVKVGQVVGKLDADDTAHAGVVKQVHLLLRRDNFADRALRVHHLGRVVGEGDDGGDKRGLGQLKHPLQEMAVPAMHAVEYADGDDGTDAEGRRGFSQGLAKRFAAGRAWLGVLRSGHWRRS